MRGPRLPRVEIHYLRPPDRLEVFRQWLVHDGADVKVSFSTGLDLPEAMVVDGRVALEDGSDVVWFTFPGAWHDIGRFHDAAGTFTGVYANVLTPVDIRAGHVWHTTDLFLDVWIPEGGRPVILDRDEMDEALERGWVDGATAERALAEAEALLSRAAQGSWPPRVVEAWTRGRALTVLGEGPPRG